MKYMGSKNRISKYILPIMLSKKISQQWWVEPFVGGGNIISKVSGNRIGSDSNYYTIEALTTIRDLPNDLPKNNTEFTELDYKNLRKNNTYKYKGYAGFAFSYGGKWLGGWRRDKINKRDYIREAYKNAVIQSSQLKGVRLLCTEYQNLYIPPNSLIYCDPPYFGTTKYKNSINYEHFWGWCRSKVTEGNTIFISEYSAPNDFICIWEKKITSSLTKETGSKIGKEKLFIHKNQIKYLDYR